MECSLKGVGISYDNPVLKKRKKKKKVFSSLFQRIKRKKRKNTYIKDSLHSSFI